MTNGIANDSKDFGLSIYPIYSIDFAHLSGGQLAGSGRTFIVERTVSKKRSARWAKNATHNSCRPHYDCDHLAFFALGPLQQVKDGNAIHRIVGLNCDLYDTRRRCRHSRVNPFQIRRHTVEVMMRTNYLPPI